MNGRVMRLAFGCMGCVIFGVSAIACARKRAFVSCSFVFWFKLNTTDETPVIIKSSTLCIGQRLAPVPDPARGSLGTKPRRHLRTVTAIIVLTRQLSVWAKITQMLSDRKFHQSPVAEKFDRFRLCSNVSWMTISTFCGAANRIPGLKKIPDSPRLYI